MMGRHLACFAYGDSSSYWTTGTGATVGLSCYLKGQGVYCAHVGNSHAAATAEPM